MVALTRLSKIVLLVGTLALGGLGAYRGQEYLRSRQVTPHVNDNLVLHLQEGRDLRDVEKIYDPADDLGFQLGNHSFTEQLPGTYVVDPEKNDRFFGLVEGRKDLTPLEIQGLAEELKRDVDVAQVEYNLPLSIPEGEFEAESRLQQALGKMMEGLSLGTETVGEYILPGAEKVNGYIPKAVREANTTAVEFYLKKAQEVSGGELQPRKSINDDLYKKGKMWGQMVPGMDKILELLEEYGYTVDDLHPVKVYVLDTGITCNHEDQETEVCVKDEHGHGTHVAGTIGASTNNEIGVSSVNIGGFVQLYAKQILDKNGRGNIVSIAKAIVDAADEGASIINMSLGGPGESTLLEKAIQYADRKGVIVVVAGGNDNTDVKYFSPANVEEAITVAAIGHKDGKIFRAPFSNHGEGVDMCAPGMEIVSTLPLESRIGKERPDKILQPGYGILQGTSMAAPHAAGHIAVMKAIDPELIREEIEEITRENGMTPETDKPISECINTEAALRVVIERKKSKEEDRQVQFLNWMEHKGYSYPNP